jgi:CHAD domain-containing protein
MQRMPGVSGRGKIALPEGGIARGASPGGAVSPARRPAGEPPLTSLLRDRGAVLMRRRREVKAGGDADAIHDLRVATRRMQEALLMFAPLLPEEPRERVRRRARRIRRQFADLRDADVLARLVQHLAADASEEDRAAILALGRTLAAKAARLRRAMARQTGGAPHVAGFRKRLRDLLESLAPSDRAALVRAGRAGLRERATELRLALARAKRGAPQPLHRARIAVKRWRYGLELAQAAKIASCAGEIETAEEIQDRLGSIHDLDVLIDLIGRDGRSVHRSETQPLLDRLHNQRRRLWEEARLELAGFRPQGGRARRGNGR